MNVVLSDLALTIPAKTTVNLLGKHYSLTPEQVLKSVSEGSIFKKRDKIWIRNAELKKEIEKIRLDNCVIPNRSKASFKFEQTVYEELDVNEISDEEYLKEHLE